MLQQTAGQVGFPEFVAHPCSATAEICRSPEEARKVQTMSWRPVRFTRHYPTALIGGIGLRLFLALSLLGEQFVRGLFPRTLVRVAGSPATLATQVFQVRDMRRRHQEGEAAHAEPDSARDRLGTEASQVHRSSLPAGR